MAITILIHTDYFFKTQLNRLISIFPLRSIFSYHHSVDPEFGHYFAGLIEGHGALILKHTNGIYKACSLQIVFHINDLEFVKVLHQRIGHGHISLFRKTQTVKLHIQELTGLLFIIHLINGKMRTPHIHALYYIIDWLNSHKLDKPIDKLPLNTSPFSDNSWLSGFIDTNGRFTINGFTNNPKLYPGFRFNVCQRDMHISDANYKPILNRIADWLKVSLCPRNKNFQWNITTSNNLSHDILITYLTSFPLFTSKYINFMDWLHVYNLVKDNKHKNPKIYKIIRIIKSNMNQNRQIFLWEHLNKFY